MAQAFEFQQQLIRAWPPPVWREVTVLVAVSGGPDSVALLRGLAAVREAGSGQLVAAHFNHGVRGDQALADEAFVVDLCRRLQIPCERGQAEWEPAARAAADALAAPPNPETPGQRVFTARSEAALRRARYRFLRETARRVGARYVATGHTADDQAETVLQRIVRGTGIAGLAGIRPHRQLVPGVALVRPLLDITRRQVQDYLDALGQHAREDSSNADRRYTRNRMRHELLPHLAAHYNANVVGALTRLAALAGDVQAVVARTLEDLQVRCVQSRSPGQVTIDCQPLAAVPRYLTRELLIAIWRQQGWPLQAMGYERWEELADLAGAPPIGPRAKMFPGAIAARRSGILLQLQAGVHASACLFAQGKEQPPAEA
jgi:tRNA(Ile)-lysidine synthase